MNAIKVNEKQKANIYLATSNIADAPAGQVSVWQILVQKVKSLLPKSSDLTLEQWAALERKRSLYITPERERTHYLKMLV